MKKNLFVSFLILFILPIHSFAQRITYNDLKYILYHTIDESETYVLRKGFMFSGITDYKGGISNYNYSKNSAKTLNYMSVAKKLYKEISYQSSFYTLSKEDYELFKLSAKKDGFVLTSTKRDEQSIIYSYELNNLVLSFWITYISEYGFPDYYITLVDKTFEEKVKTFRQINR